MRKLALAAVAAGLLGAASLAPSFAASTEAGVSSEVSAQRATRTTQSRRGRNRGDGNLGQQAAPSPRARRAR